MTCTCSCGATCWAVDWNDGDRCEGELHVSEDYDGIYVHYCEWHGHFDDWEQKHPGEEHPISRNSSQG